MLNVRTSGNPTSHSLPLTRFYQPHLGPCQCSRRARARSALPWLQRPRLPQFKGHFSALQSITSALGSPPLGWPVHLRLSLLACSQSGGGGRLWGALPTPPGAAGGIISRALSGSRWRHRRPETELSRGLSESSFGGRFLHHPFGQQLGWHSLQVPFPQPLSPPKISGLLYFFFIPTLQEFCLGWNETNIHVAIKPFNYVRGGEWEFRNRLVLLVHNPNKECPWKDKRKGPGNAEEADVISGAGWRGPSKSLEGQSRLTRNPGPVSHWAAV